VEEEGEEEEDLGVVDSGVEGEGTVVNNQLSGAGKVEIDLIHFLFKPSSYLYRFNSYPIGLDT
jgi:hypothetical protein